MMWYEDLSQYVIEDALGERSWPLSLALVHVFERRDEEGNLSVITTPGWGRKNFMKNYTAGKFRPNNYLRRFQHGRAFGFVMRSLPMVVIDIDGKNGGFPASRALHLPPTLAERSKSGNGLHLFYRLPNEVWDNQYGYDQVPDFNGIVPGIDVRSSGIVYHYPGQRWNRLPIADLPIGMQRLFDAKKRQRESYLSKKEQMMNLDEEDKAIYSYELLAQLREPIEAGQRNTWLFAWGCRSRRIVPDWELHLAARAESAGLDIPEIVNIINNVKKYGNGE